MPQDRVIGNIFSALPESLPEELFQPLAESDSVRIERIVSLGHGTPEGEWYDQERDEWVLLLSGGAGLLFEGEESPRRIEPGDWLLIPAHCRHRVAWTDKRVCSIWLAVHFQGGTQP
jgi:cupin 2 domain-containing protein